ncbi:hypothetical protein [Sphingobium algorifonticola]|uniref:Uncharacterized protein n=1 Tax=Sphingobium algorifonticola TaxID=2008318 RepID=A0A437J5P0_9SPHN|nr:hypothetical protein [Sphingobium algorifonticola]RVT39934.1 hypothetical protein ENE74_14225 [Sphingobium algorifonticola]
MQTPYLTDRASVDDAADLMHRYGDDAAYEAVARADRSRDKGNYIHFCRWRQIERLIVLLSIELPIGTIH